MLKSMCETSLVFLWLKGRQGNGSANWCHRYHVERFLREVIIPRLAPISREMCLNYLAEKVLGLPRSY